MPAFEELISSGAFELFSEPGELNNYCDFGVIIDRGVEVADEDGNVRFVAAVVNALKSDFPEWSSGDLLEADSGNVRLRQLISDDGYMLKIEASPVA